MVRPLALTLMLFSAACTDIQQVLFAPGIPDAATPDAAMPPSETLGATDVSSGDYHSCAVLDGGLWCWGTNPDGELGASPLGMALPPLHVGTDTDWQRVVAGAQSTCGIKGAGQVWCWGLNGSGEVGRGDFQLQLTPYAVSLPLPATALDVYSHTCVLLSDSSLWCWGANMEGQLGQNDGFTSPNLPTPVVVAMGTTFKSLCTGQGQTCAVQSNGTLWCWGRNTVSQCGLGPDAGGQYRSPQQVGADSDWAVVRCGQQGTCALKDDGSLWCWGGSSEAPLGERTDAVPTRVGADNDWQSLDVETFFSCALKRDGSLWCWGRGVEGQLGLGDFQDHFGPPLQVSDGGIRQVTTGRFFRCVRDARSAVQCNGDNRQGEVNANSPYQQPNPVPILFQ
jgi:alpha-tubulin suppressor-like RCC1 family protein